MNKRWVVLFLLPFLQLSLVFGNSDFRYERTVETLFPANNNHCLVQATYRAEGTIRYLEGFTGLMDGDLGRRELPSVFNSTPFREIDYNETVIKTREIPNRSSPTVQFVNQHIPYDLPFQIISLTHETCCEML